MVRSSGTPPPIEFIAARKYVAWRCVAVPRWVPLCRDVRGDRGEAVGNRYSLTRAEWTATPCITVVKRVFPFMIRTVLAFPPHTLRRTRNNGLRINVGGAGWVQFRHKIWPARCKRVLRSDALTRALRAAITLSSARRNTYAPFMGWIASALPPHRCACVSKKVTGVLAVVAVRMQLGSDRGFESRQTISYRDLPARACETTASENGSRVNSGAPDVIWSLGALPPSVHAAVYRDLLWSQFTIFCGVPLGSNRVLIEHFLCSRCHLGVSVFDASKFLLEKCLISSLCQGQRVHGLQIPIGLDLHTVGRANRGASRISDCPHI